jgi:L-2-hydroxyglutarate oxidase LhgO
MSDIEYAIIGGGAIGRSIAYALGLQGSSEVVVIEKAPPTLIENQSTRNSGVIHSGIYYQRRSRPLKAKLCVLGNSLLYQFCRDFDVAHAQTGKLVVATTQAEEERLDEIYKTALENQVPGVALLSAAEASAMEPMVTATKALYAPSSGIIDAAGYLRALQRAGKSHNLFATEVQSISKSPHGFKIKTRSQNREDEFVARRVINAAGLYADDVAKMLDPTSPYTITPVRGESAKFYLRGFEWQGMSIYPVPERFTTQSGQTVETLGVHLTPTLDEAGGIAPTVTIGPAIRSDTGKEDYGNNLRPPEFYWEKIRAFLPAITKDQIQLHQCGIQARLAGRPDWIIEPARQEPGFVNLIGIDSPGLTASLAIADHVVSTLLD